LTVVNHWPATKRVGGRVSPHHAAIIAAIFGFGGIATTAAGIAQILFVVFIVLFLASLIYHLISERRPPPPLS
jgi:uncharacterized membrane protein YtjA (UPF0391 family)